LEKLYLTSLRALWKARGEESLATSEELMKGTVPGSGGNVLSGKALSYLRAEGPALSVVRAH